MNQSRFIGFVVVLGMVILTIFGLPQPSAVEAQGCSVTSFTMSPTDPYSLGTAVILNGTSNCGTVRFEIQRMSDGHVWHKAEIGSTSQNETWRTSETGSGNFSVCFVGHQTGGWENAARSCRTVYVEGSSAPPPGSNPGDDVRCWVNSLTVTPISAAVGHTFQLAGQGQCDGNARAIRFTIDGSPFGEFGGNTHGTDWNSSGYNTGSHRICVQITAGNWAEDAAESCTTITLNSSGNASNDVSQGPPADNGQTGQTPNSGPNGNGNVGNSGSNNSGSSNSSNNSGSGTSCNSRSRLHVGDIALISDADPYSLAMRLRASSSSLFLIDIPIRTAITIIGGPECSGGNIWWETQYGGETGWVDELNSYGNYNLIPNGMALPGGSQSSGSGNIGSTGNSGNSRSVNSSSCSGANAPTLSDGDRGRVTFTDGTPTSLWNTPQGDVMDRLAEGTQFDVISDPTCTTARRGHLWWVQVRTDSGQRGWVSFGYSGEAYWIEPVSGSNGSNNTVAGMSPTQVLTFQVYSEILEYTHVFEVDIDRCIIVNGADVVAAEISRFESWYQSLSLLSKTPEVVGYFSPVIGDIDTFRQVSVDGDLAHETNCSTLVYAVDTRRMDTSGLGNIVFGFFSFRYSQHLEDMLSNVEQAANPRSFLQFVDNVDDTRQRRTGRAIAQEIGIRASPSSDTVIRIAEEQSLR